ncbi:MAG TPA: A24 family peptidase [Tepidisphaeraceae bacterium]|jgi:prepilin peptidase CpaA|nr:A24 family peptidase [Tepidisphaeraceae bacterium]
MAWPVLIVWAPLIGALAAAAVIDARQRRIPNWLTFGLLAAGLGRAAVAGPGSLGHSALGILAGGAIPLVLYTMSAIGAGDVKLLAAIGAWVGPGPALLIFMVQALLGLVIVITQAVAQRRTGTLLRNSALIIANFGYVSELGLQNAVETGKSSRSINRPLPFAVPVFIATVIVLSTGKFLGR